MQNTMAVTEIDFARKWLIELTLKDNNVIGKLELSKQNNHWIGHTEEGPVKVSIDGSSIALTIDSRNLEGFVFERNLTGKLLGDEITGTYYVVGTENSAAKTASWIGRCIKIPATKGTSILAPSLLIFLACGYLSPDGILDNSQWI